MAEVTDPLVARNGSIMTCDGKLFDVLNPTVEAVDINVIAHGLAKKDRASGHYDRVWSVAEHSMFAAAAAQYYADEMGLSKLEIAKCTLKALLHDGSEAYLVDLPRPVKHLPGFERYREIEGKLQDTIYEWAGLSSNQFNGIVHRADNEVLKAEFLWFLNGSEMLEWPKDVDHDMLGFVMMEEWPELLEHRTWRDAKDVFIETYDMLITAIAILEAKNVLDDVA